MKNTKVLWGVIVFLVICLGVLLLVGAYFFLSSKYNPTQLETSAPTQPVQVIETPGVVAYATLFPTYTPLPTYTVPPTLQPTYTPFPTYTREPTYTPVTEAMFTANEPAFCREGPSEIVWWDPKEALNEGQTVKIVGKSTYEWGLWWLVQKPSGTRCWVYSELGSISGNVAGVPEVYAPATPTPTILRVTIKNNHLFPLCNVWVENSGANNWVDLLNGLALDPSDKIKLDLFPGSYDFVFYDCFGNEVDSVYNLDITPDNTRFVTP